MLILVIGHCWLIFSLIGFCSSWGNSGWQSTNLCPSGSLLWRLGNSAVSHMSPLQRLHLSHSLRTASLLSPTMGKWVGDFCPFICPTHVRSSFMFRKVKLDAFCPSLYLLENKSKILHPLCCAHALELSIRGYMGCIASGRQSQLLFTLPLSFLAWIPRYYIFQQGCTFLTQWPCEL